MFKGIVFEKLLFSSILKNRKKWDNRINNNGTRVSNYFVPEYTPLVYIWRFLFVASINHSGRLFCSIQADDDLAFTSVRFWDSSTLIFKSWKAVKWYELLMPRNRDSRILSKLRLGNLRFLKKRNCLINEWRDCGVYFAVGGRLYRGRSPFDSVPLLPIVWKSTLLNLNLTK